MQQEGYRSLRLVTSWYHMRRSLLEFSRAMPRVAMVAHPVFAQMSTRKAGGTARAGQRVFGEYDKFLVAWLRCLIVGAPKAPALPVVRTIARAGENAWPRHL